MDFRTATDRLFSGITQGQLADALGCKIPSIRQARLDPKAKSYRQPPRDWQAAIAKLATAEAGRLTRLAEAMKKAVDTAEGAAAAETAVHVRVKILKGGVHDGRGGVYTVSSVVSVAPGTARQMIERGQAEPVKAGRE